MSRVSRSVYQKCKEENKRLKMDLEILIMNEDPKKRKEIFRKWYRHFDQKRQFNNFFKKVITDLKK